MEWVAEEAVQCKAQEPVWAIAFTQTLKRDGSHAITLHNATGCSGRQAVVTTTLCLPHLQSGKLLANGDVHLRQ